MRKQLLTLLLLHYLYLRPSYGYELKQRLKLDSGGLLTIGDATLYRILLGFERQGWVQRDVKMHGRQERVYYSLNEFGLAQYMLERTDFAELNSLVVSIVGEKQKA